MVKNLVTLDTDETGQKEKTGKGKGEATLRERSSNDVPKAFGKEGRKSQGTL